jgi:PadR family transcriptional regulator PadR
MTEPLQVQLRKGVLELCVLALLSQQESYAYELANRLAGDVGMGEGTIYPLMRRLQNDGLVSTHMVQSSSGPSRKYYKLTAAGRAAFAAQKADWLDFVAAINRTLGESA